MGLEKLWFKKLKFFVVCIIGFLILVMVFIGI